MAHPRTRPGGHVLFSTGEKLTSADLNEMGGMALQSVWNGLAARLFGDADGDPISGFVGDDCKVTVSGLTATIAAGMGVYYDTDETDAFNIDYRPIVVPTSTTQAILPHDANERWDLICLAPATDDDENENRNVKNPSSGAISTSAVDKRRKLYYSLTYVSGTPSATPADPVATVGSIPIARLRVPASAGTVSVDDLRPVLRIGTTIASEPPEEYALNFVPGSGTELEVTANSPAALNVVVAGGEAVIQGQRYRFGRQVVTVTAAHATLDRTDRIVADADGTIQCLAGTAGGAPATPADDQVLLADISVPSTASGFTAVTSGLVGNARERRPYSGTSHIRDESIVSDHLATNIKPVRATLTATAEASNAIAVTVAAKDLSGGAMSSVTMFARLLSASMDTLSAASWGIAETGFGTEISTSGGTGLLFTTNGSGAATITVTDDSGSFSGSVVLMVEPIDVPSVKSYIVLTFA